LEEHTASIFRVLKIEKWWEFQRRFEHCCYGHSKQKLELELKILKMVMALIFTVNNNSATAPNSVKNTLSLLFLLFQRIDYIYMTGDIIDHGVWNTSIQKNSDIITKVLQQLTTEFPDTPVYPILGNHEPSPLNV